MQECYDILEINQDASSDEIRRAFRDQIKVWHPDRFVGDERLQSKAIERTKRIIYAYESLMLLRAERRGMGSGTTRDGSSAGCRERPSPRFRKTTRSHSRAWARDNPWASVALFPMMLLWRIMKGIIALPFALVDFVIKAVLAHALRFAVMGLVALYLFHGDQLRSRVLLHLPDHLQSTAQITSILSGD